MDPRVDDYLLDGCGRCPLGGTPECKVHRWTEELDELRQILLDSRLTEDLKWSVPCYTYEDTNVLLLSAFNDFCSLNFFKGVLLEDPAGLLVSPGPNSRSARYLKVTSAEYVRKNKEAIKALIENAVQVEEQGLKVDLEKNDQLEIPEELEMKFEDDPVFKSAFEDLTPGRQRGYVIYFSAPKQSKTRSGRIERYVSKIMEGKGFHDR